ncbi:hypothetical protein [Synechococcus phage S-B05]|nr:hypothetical protein [Synechococcus phage S-B05]QCW22867.1 hypothetical protein [Synechococcus phage S-B05]
MSLIPYSGFLLPIMNIDTKLITIIESLQDGVNVSHDALNNPDQGYPYATGYSRATMQYCIDNLETIINQYRTITLEESK